MADMERALAGMDEESRRTVLRELVRMQLDLQELGRAGALLTDMAFLGAKCRAGLLYELLAEFARADALGAPGIGPWRRFLDEQSHVLGVGPHLFAQQAVNRPRGDPVGRTAQRLQIDEPYLELLNKEPADDSPLAPVRTLYDYGSLTTGVGITPDGRTAVSVDLTHRLRVWDLETGRCVRRLGQPYATAVALSADGLRIVAAGMHDLELWDLRTGVPETLSPTQHSQVIRAVAMTPDGRRAVSGGDETVVLWDLERRCPHAVFGGHGDEVLAVAITDDGRLAVSASKDRTVRLWDVPNRRCARVLEGHDGAVYGLAMTGDGRLIVSGAEDRLVKVWEEGEWRADLPGHADSVDALGMSADGSCCVSGSSDGEVRFWDVPSRSCRAAVRGHAFALSAVAVTPDGRRALTGAWDGKVKLWDLGDLDGLPASTAHTPAADAVHEAVLAPSGRRAVVGDSAGRLHLWDVGTARRVGSFGVRGSEVHGVAFAPDERHVFSGHGDGTVRRCALITGATTVLGRHDDAVRALAVSPDGPTVLSGSDDKSIRLWDPARGECVGVMKGHEEPVVAVVARPGLVVSAESSRIRHWDPGRRVCRHVTSLPDGPQDSLMALALSPSGRILAAAGLAGLVWLWDTESKELVGVLSPVRPAMMVHKLAFTRTGLLVTAGADNYLRVWDVPEQRNIASFPTAGNVHAMDVGDDVMICGDSLGGIFLLRFRPGAARSPGSSAGAWPTGRAPTRQASRPPGA
ncbi:WD40 repeat domain-containing protein [Streptomyces hiroshimensis]|uniref:WD40 repeat domain-containing protein n=1 Tax=Streptomyces hiroshimensis TaxID=66424 RepID=A0ABQ2Y5X3_9ACTN|nr:WD40 repeat domain-containing protein [Streptomyces hiroshimensis]GGX66188.1 hypothetical protein GCM10010324_09100 [Streptomyces hiroshimensis]